MVITSYLVDEKDKKSRFFKKTFLLADVSMNVALGILFFTLNNIKIHFNNRELKQRYYITAKALPTTGWVELIRKNEFAIATLDLDNETFVVHVEYLASFDQDLEVQSSSRAQIVS